MSTLRRRDERVNPDPGRGSIFPERIEIRDRSGFGADAVLFRVAGGAAPVYELWPAGLVADRPPDEPANSPGFLGLVIDRARRRMLRGAEQASFETQPVVWEVACALAAAGEHGGSLDDLAHAMPRAPEPEQLRKLITQHARWQFELIGITVPRARGGRYKLELL